MHTGEVKDRFHVAYLTGIYNWSDMKKTRFDTVVNYYVSHTDAS
jgi:hypothetical protein